MFHIDFIVLTFYSSYLMNFFCLSFYAFNSNGPWCWELRLLDPNQPPKKKKPSPYKNQENFVETQAHEMCHNATQVITIFLKCHKCH